MADIWQEYIDRAFAQWMASLEARGYKPTPSLNPGFITTLPNLFLRQFNANNPQS